MVLFNTSLRTDCMVSMTDQNNQPLTRKALKEQAEAIAREQNKEAKKEIEDTVKQVELDEEGNPQFKVPSSLTGSIPVTNIVVEAPVDITAGGAIITEAGELVTTGSIDVSAFITSTGEIDVIQIDSGDDDLDKDAQKNQIPGIPPMRVSGIIAKNENQPALPGGAHRGLNPYFYVGLITLAALLIGGGVTIAFMTGFFG